MIEVGKVYDSNSIKNLLVIEEGKSEAGVSYALLKANNTYIVACGVTTDEMSGKIDWRNGIYRENLLSATVEFQKFTMQKSEKINQTMTAFKDLEPFILVSSIIEHIQESEKEKITDYDLQKLEILFDKYTSNDDMKLLSEEIMDLEDELNFDNIEQEIIDYLKDNGIDVTTISNEEIKDMVEDVVEHSSITDEDISSLIWIEDYFGGKVDELKEQEDTEEDER